MSPWVREFRRAHGLRLYCFSHSGAGASTFKQWPELLPPEIEVRGIQLPGREDRLREPPFVSLHALVHALAPELEVDRPYAFFGHSVGALLAFELARELRRRGLREPVKLVVSGCCSPDVEDDEPPLSALPDERFIEALRQMNGTPEPVLRDPELMALLLPTLRADFMLYESYEYSPAPPLASGILAMGGLADQRTSASALDRWASHTRTGFERHMFPGDHFFIQTNREAVVLATGAALQAREA